MNYAGLIQRCVFPAVGKQVRVPFLTVTHTLSSTSDNNAVTKVTLQLMIFSDPSTNTPYNSIRATEMSNVICLYQALSGSRRAG